MTTAFVLSSDVSSFNASAFREALLAQFPGAQDVVLSISVASIRVLAKMIMESPEAAEVAATTITNTTVETMQKQWFTGTVSINSIVAPVLVNEIIFAPSPPPPVLPPPSPPLPPQPSLPPLPPPRSPPLPILPPPALPPALPPGWAWHAIVSFSMILQGTASDFGPDQTGAIEQGLARLLVVRYQLVSQVTIQIAAASVRLDVNVTAENFSEGPPLLHAVTSLTGENATLASIAGAAVLNVTAPTMATLAVLLTSPPSHPPTAPPPMRMSDEELTAMWIGIVVLGACLVAMLVLWYRLRSNHKSNKVLPSTMTPPVAVSPKPDQDATDNSTAGTLGKLAALEGNHPTLERHDEGGGVLGVDGIVGPVETEEALRVVDLNDGDTDSALLRRTREMRMSREARSSRELRASREAQVRRLAGRAEADGQASSRERRDSFDAALSWLKRTEREGPSPPPFQALEAIPGSTPSSTNTSAHGGTIAASVPLDVLQRIGTTTGSERRDEYAAMVVQAACQRFLAMRHVERLREAHRTREAHRMLEDQRDRAAARLQAALIGFHKRRELRTQRAMAALGAGVVGMRARRGVQPKATQQKPPLSPLPSPPSSSLSTAGAEARPLRGLSWATVSGEGVPLPE